MKLTVDTSLSPADLAAAFCEDAREMVTEIAASLAVQ